MLEHLDHLIILFSLYLAPKFFIFTPFFSFNDMLLITTITDIILRLNN